MSSLKELLFSYTGRISRSRFWGGFFLSLFIPIGVAMATIIPLGLLNISSEIIVSVISFLIAASMIGFTMYAQICLFIKRLHDLDKTGWFSLLMFIPFVNFILFIILGCIQGTAGGNQYGPDPLLAQVFSPAPLEPTPVLV